MKKNEGKLGKKGQTWKNGSHLEKLVTRREVEHTRKNGPHLEKWVTLEEKDHTWGNGYFLDTNNWVHWLCLKQQ